MTKKIAIGVALIFAFCFLAAWFYSVQRAARAGSPRAFGTNLVAFLQSRPETNQILRFIFNSKVHVEFLAKPGGSTSSTPSGSPVFIFDETGALEDTCRDIGDNPSFVKKWGGFSNATPISVEEAQELLSEH